MTLQDFTIDAAQAEAILDRRGRALEARTAASNVAAGEHIAVVIALAGAKAFAMPMQMIAGVVVVERISPIPSGNPALQGAISHRNEVWTTYSLAALSGSPISDGDLTILKLRGTRPRKALSVWGGVRADRVVRADFKAFGDALGIISGISESRLHLVDQASLLGALHG